MRATAIYGVRFMAIFAPPYFIGVGLSALLVLVTGWRWLLAFGWLAGMIVGATVFLLLIWRWPGLARWVHGPSD